MLLLDNPVQAYAWGPRNGLAGLVGSSPTGGHEAELWIGTHHRGPSVVASGPLAGRTLAEVIAAEPARWLGAPLADAGWTGLPYLLKVLAIEAPLSLQAHPSTAQAEAGFAREEAAGVPLDADHRTYRDRSAKPEVLVALVDTWAMCGFRSPDGAAALVAPAAALAAADALSPLVSLLSGEGGPQGGGCRAALSWLLQLEEPQRAAVADAAVHGAAALATAAHDDPWRWVGELAQRYRGDPTCLAPLLLEVVHLAPGEAVHLPAGNLHAYLLGAGVEVMASSDNVLRGGLTGKYVDVAELLATLVFEPGVPPAPRRSARGPVTSYDAGEPAFAVARIEPSTATVDLPIARPSLLLPVGGPASIERDGEAPVTTRPGQAVFVEPGGPVSVHGDAPVWWATTGDGLGAP